ncbi:hypothetical protein BpHYR1_035421 [Brachionus plicatilis]|uniref:Uncharacterized protein n=1 Tax=Brachionus plicatilis TaxID=10195 RepID=A0A3M7QFA6_BRAPC|nr:hypothetical protein BpHYR1_035421 [Brachionus plicatilis]
MSRLGENCMILSLDLYSLKYYWTLNENIFQNFHDSNVFFISHKLMTKLYTFGLQCLFKTIVDQMTLFQILKMKNDTKLSLLRRSQNSSDTVYILFKK